MRSGEKNGNTVPAGNGTLAVGVDNNNRLKETQERLLRFLLCRLLETK